MNGNVRSLLPGALLVAALIVPGPLNAQTDGTARFEGRLLDYNGSSLRHYTVVWVTTASGTFIKTLRKQGPLWGSNEWGDHCAAWNNARAGSQALDGYSSATAQDYTGTNSPVIWTWNCRNASGQLVPDGTYKFWMQYAENSGQGPYTTNGLLWTKGPASADLTFPNHGTITNLRVLWAPVAAPPKIAAVNLDQGNLLLAGTGPALGTYRVLAATQADASIAQWLPIQTNTFGANGAFSISLPVSTAVPQRFYRLQTQ